MSNPLALSKRSADTDLMPPPPIKRMKRPPKVLSEEDYSANLDYIIARDYFPGLLEADAQQDYLNALDAGNEDWMEEAGQRVKAVMTPGRPSKSDVGMTPRRPGLPEVRGGKTPTGWVGATPSATPRQSKNVTQENAESKNEGASTNKTKMSLGSYQATYTSEDNTSFASVIDEQNAKRREKYRWLWSGNNKTPSKQQLLQHQQDRHRDEKKALEAPHYFSARFTGSSPSSTALIKASDAKLSFQPYDRPAMIDKKPHHPRNGLFFNPDDMAETHPHLQSQAETAAQMSKAAPKGVSHANTRVALDAEGVAQTKAAEDEDRPPSPTMSAVDAAMQGRPHPALRKGGTYADSEVSAEDGTGGETPMVNGWKFVDAEVPVETPSPRPLKKREKVDHDSLLTSLVQSSTGNDGDDGAGSNNPFNIAEPRKREELHYAMVEKQNKAKRAKNDRLESLKGHDTGKTPKFMSSPRVGALLKGAETSGRTQQRLGGLTPAARALYEKVGGKTPVARRRVDATPFGGKMTPTPIRRIK